jgi:hypothetical protein
MPNLLPMVFIALVSTALMLTLLWLWQSVRETFVHGIVATRDENVVSPQRASLLAEKASLLVALRDLEAERDSGKLSGDDFRELNEQYRIRAREVLRELDALLSPHRSAAQALLKSAASGDVAAASRASKPVVAETPAAPSCTSCGVANDVDAVFCKKCGARLRTEAPA